MQDLHEEDVVTVESLRKAIGAGEDEVPFLTYVLEKAKESADTEAGGSGVTLSDKTRLIGRIDANVMDMVRFEHASLEARSVTDSKAVAKNLSVMQERFGRIE